ncbi:uncharacterized protein LOC117780133 isoform X2 [Drosophila innubila]|uniref:uncharacterized protein LOC117780133 isoform X2 n=1 Tax=Drosophila innubila TaxID=198719 RepID=UPI00148C32DA|nr:uncharacterized protein LOC117780133 isoform X2 [Drosophila innubila]
MYDRKRKKRRLDNFDTDSKIALIEAVHEKRLLWDVEDKRHFDGVFVKQAWQGVADSLNKNVNACKMAWKSIRDSYRYHCKSSEKKQAQSARAEGAQSEQPKVYWHLAPYLSFLPDLNSKRRTFNSAFEVEESTSQDKTLDPFESQATEAVQEYLSFSNLFDVDDSQLDADASISNHESTHSIEENPKKIRKVEKSAEVAQEVIISKPSECLDPLETSLSTPVRSVVLYWESILNKMDPKVAEAAERAVTKLLWKYAKAKFNDKNDTIADATEEHDATNFKANEVDLATIFECETDNLRTHCLPKSRNHNLKEDTHTLIQLQKDLLQRKEQRAQEMHDQNMLREKAKLDLEVQEGKLRVKIIELEILEKRAKLDMIYNQ